MVPIKYSYTSSNPYIRSARLYGQFSLDKTWTLQAGSSVFSPTPGRKATLQMLAYLYFGQRFSSCGAHVRISSKRARRSTSFSQPHPTRCFLGNCRGRQTERQTDTLVESALGIYLIIFLLTFKAGLLWKFHLILRDSVAPLEERWAAHATLEKLSGNLTAHPEKIRHAIFSRI